MRLSDGLKAKIADLLDRMEAMSKRAADENRLFDETEGKAWDSAEREVKDLQRQLERQEKAEALARGDRGGAQPVTPGGPGLITDDGKVLRTLRKTDKLVDLLPRGAARPEVRIGHVLRGIVHGDWRGVGKPLEQTVGGGAPPPRAVGENVWSPAVFPVPESISNQWLDMARAASVCFQAGAITMPMPTTTVRIVGVTQDPVFTWRKEHKPIPESDILLGPIDLKAKLCGAIVRTSVELIEDSPMAMDLIETVLMRAAGFEIDKALLSGDGDTTGDLDNPTGLLHWPGVPSVPAVVPPTNYDPLIDAYASVLAANGVPNAMISGAATAAAFAKIKTGLAGDNTTLAAPALIADLDKYFTSAMPANTSVVGDFSMLAWGLRTGMTLEVTRVGGNDTFKNAQVLIRLYFRGDTAVLRPSWFAKVAPAGP
jgi:HK97 family phage major capsid protein